MSCGNHGDTSQYPKSNEQDHLEDTDDHESRDHNNNEDDDDHEHDLVMPGFRFYPTEEELIEFYLRRKVEGKRFNVELITFLDLYRYDPWELPALAAIGEKEWYFYVPRDRKYRNGDRPNRVTKSGYWKATGADRMIRSENGRAMGLKKTLVFYSGKAPKGHRTCWFMNEYRLPHHLHGPHFYLKAEISLCRVYKRPGVEDNSSLPRSLPTRYHHHHDHNASSSGHHPSSPNYSDKNLTANNNSSNVAMELADHHHRHYHQQLPRESIDRSISKSSVLIGAEDDGESDVVVDNSVDELQRLQVDYQKSTGAPSRVIDQQYSQAVSYQQDIVMAAAATSPRPQIQDVLTMNTFPAAFTDNAYPDRLQWEISSDPIRDRNTRDHI